MTRQVGTPRSSAKPISEKPVNRRLNGWKEISASLGRDERTAKRWATDRGLPVHRVPGLKRSSVYAWSEEIDVWLKPQAVVDNVPVTVPLLHNSSSRRKVLTTVSIFALCAIALITAVASFSVGRWTSLDTAPSRSSMTSLALPQSVRELYLDANYLWQKRTPETLSKAESLLLQVVAQAPGFAPAQADLATVYNLMVEIAVLPADDGYRRSEVAARKTIALDSENAQAYTVLGDLEFYWHHDFPAGLRMFQQALAISPDNSLARQWYASALMSSGRFNEAAVEIDRARELEPTSRSIKVSAAMIALGQGDIERARQMLLELVANEPEYRSPYRFLSFIAIAQRDRSGYLVALANRFRITGDALGRSIVDVGMDNIEAETDGAFAQAMLAAVGEGQVEPYFHAQLLALAGNWEEAADQLGRTPTRQAFYYSIDPAFAPARNDPKFLQRIASLGLPAVP